MLKTVEKDSPLSEMVPEYDSSIPLIRNFFFDRIKYSILLGGINDNSKILDVGCGIGYLFGEIRKKNKKCQLTGIDFNINVAKLSVPGCKFKVEDCTQLSFKEDSFDVVYALDSLEHIERIDVAVEQIKRVLKAGGKLIITGPTESSFYKFCRFLLKGTFSKKEDAGTDFHYHTVNGLHKAILRHKFTRETGVDLPRFCPLVLEKVIRYNNEK